MSAAPRYDHTQRAPLHWLLWACLALCVVVGVLVDEPTARLTLAFMALLCALFGASFIRLRVVDEGEALAVRFGPLPLLAKRVRYADLRAARPARSRFIDGWGVHWVPGRGWTWNLWGFDCVELDTARGRLRVGTDEPERLAAFLRERIDAEAGRTPPI